MKIHCDYCKEHGVIYVGKFGYDYFVCANHWIKYRQQEGITIRVWVCGSRTIKSYMAVEKILNEIFSSVQFLIIRTGGAIGVDRLAEQWGRNRNAAVKRAIMPDYARYRGGAPFERNTEGVDWADIIVAIWDGHSTGTKNCIDKAKKREKVLIKVMI